MFSANSSSTLYGSFAFTTPLATSTPSVPSFKAAATSLPVVMPAPQRTITLGLTCFMSFMVFVTTSGLALDTGMPVPINSGGSMAVMLGLSAAVAALTKGLLAQTIETRFSSRALLIVASMSASFNCLSE